MSSNGRFFADRYGEARQKFLDAARGQSADLREILHPRVGPFGERLGTDVARIGPDSVDRLLVIICGTHGIEGYVGSAIEAALLSGGVARQISRRCGVLLVHAINPWGFAYGHRNDDGNVDCNRNFIDFSQAPPANPGYDELHHSLLPTAWNSETIAEGQRAISKYREKHGEVALRVAHSGGQWTHPDGMYFGGYRPNWSHVTLRDIVQAYARGVRNVAVVDIHSGLGPFGHGTVICCLDPKSQELALLKSWVGGEISAPLEDPGFTPMLAGVNHLAMPGWLPDSRVFVSALEFGTLPPVEVRTAVRGDIWLLTRGNRDTSLGRDILRAARAAFAPESAEWRSLVVDGALETIGRIARGLGEL
jgi:Protein of unknown function (DUF2817)